MPKYKLSIADLEINVTTSEAPDMVHTLEGMLDRRIREIIAKSPRCSKSEAAILCALDYCAESIKGETKTRDMEHEYVQMSRSLDALKQENAELTEQLEKLRRENTVMSDILSKAAAPVVEAAEAALPVTEEVAEGEQIALSLPTQPAEEVPAEDSTAQAPAATDVMFEGEHVEATEEKPVKKTRRSSRSKVTASSKNKVGDMFDMLTFKDV
jgi:cell division protein ZapA (FtsZ GTPase activity inhibitor)